MGKDQVKMTVCRNEAGKEYWVAKFADLPGCATVFQMRTINHHNVFVMHLFGSWGRLNKSRYHGLAHAFMVGDSLPSTMFPSSSDLKSILAVHSQELPQGVDGDYLDQVCSRARDAISLQWGIKFNPLIRNTVRRVAKQYPQCSLQDIVSFTREALFELVTTTIRRKAKRGNVLWEQVQGYIKEVLYWDSIRLVNSWTVGNEKYESLDALVCSENENGFTYAEITPTPAPYIPPSVPDISQRYKDPAMRYITENPEKGAAECQRLLAGQGYHYSKSWIRHCKRKILEALKAEAQTEILTEILKEYERKDSFKKLNRKHWWDFWEDMKGEAYLKREHKEKGIKINENVYDRMKKAELDKLFEKNSDRYFRFRELQTHYRIGGRNIFFDP